MTPVQPNARDRILSTAHDLFYRDGIRATGIDKIINEAAVTKVTFYRHFPAKDDLIRAFLDYRHDRWISWFRATLEREIRSRQNFATALETTLEEWFASKSFRGCAFINTAVEMAEALPESLIVARRHKQDMTDVLASFLPESENRLRRAAMVALVVDGAIVKAQREKSPDAALKVLADALNALLKD